MNKTPSLEDLNFLIKNIYQTSSKLKGNIKITKLEDAANFVAYLYGFSSWFELQKLINNDSKYQLNEKFSFKIKKFSALYLKKDNIEGNFINKLIKNKSKKHILNKNHKESNIIPYEWLIGKRQEKNSKTIEPIGLESDNFIISSSNLKHVNPILKTNIEHLINKKQSFFIFGLDDLELIDDIKKKHTLEIEFSNLYQIGKNSFKIDPISDAFECDDLESLFNISLNDEELDTFIIIWLMIIRTLKDDFNYTLNSETLLESLKIEALLDILFYLENKNQLLYQYLKQYLIKRCFVKIEANDISIHENGLEKHYHQTYIINEKLEKINQLYKKGFFSENSNIKLYELISNKDSALFLECDELELRKDYWQLCHLSYLNAHKKYSKSLADQSLNANLYKVWSLWWRANDTLDEFFSTQFNNIDTHIISAYVFSDTQKLNSWFENFKQILFLRQPFPTITESWKNRALSNTNYWENNLFFNQCEILRKLKNDEAYLWKKNLENNPKKLEHFHLIKIQLYLKNMV